ncbi:glycosyltransferase family 2 protein [Streptomyces sp. cg35]|uniref:glycosyltransferase family 2 protein n=1 Tax=Streptomyces sp. cg35 TaxID=3421650 RepID=UPI003D170C71
MQKTAVGEPDVSVIVAVYNTMPYLTECLASLVGQTIGTDRIEIVAVDDGSTDGSDKELQTFAERYPGVLTVVHQENSGGPAAPSNRALDLARGRYVFFLGADDHLGSEALERMVEAADRLGSDIVLGRMVGVNGRWVSRAVFTESRDEATLFDSALPWALSNTKLFRRSLVEEHGLRFPEDLPVLSDQPFTLEACFRAGRITVLADYDYYFAVRRDDATNATVSYRALDRLRGTRRLMDLTRRMTEPGQGRDWIHRRHFTWEVARLIGPEFLELSPEDQRTVCDGVGDLHRECGSEFALRKLTSEQRLLLRLAERGELGLMRAVLECAAAGGPRIVVDGKRAYAGHPCFRDAGLGLPDAWFDITKELKNPWAEQTFAPAEASWSGEELVIRMRGSLPELARTAGTDVVRARAESLRPGDRQAAQCSVGLTAVETDGAGGTDIELRYDGRQLFPRKGAVWSTCTLGLKATALGVTHVVPLAAVVPARRHRHRMRSYRISVEPADEHPDVLTLRVTRVPVGQLVRRCLGMLRRRT